MIRIVDAGNRITKLVLPLLVAVLGVLVAVHPVAAGGGPQNVLLVVDPTDGDALQIANAYQAARGIPASNVLYLPPTAKDYRSFVSGPREAVLETMRQRGIDDHIDYIVVAGGHSFFMPAPGLVVGYIDPSDHKEYCPVSRVSLSGAWTLANQAPAILAGPTYFTETNHFYADEDAATAFDGGRGWRNGRGSTGADAERYFIGFQLGYSGERGNTVTDTLAMIDRSVAADGTRPTGTFYYMKNGDIRSVTRTPFFQRAVDGLIRLGAKAEIVDGSLPIGRHDALGILAGSSDLPISSGDFSLLAGAFADHLTSFAATFDVGSQTKMSEWIAKGASGTMGTVEEPCVFGSDQSGEYQEKFPHPRLFLWSFQGLSLGEALFRSIPWKPFQGMFYGDPLTRPFAFLPQVSVREAAPGLPVTGNLHLTPTASSLAPSASIAGLALFVDGIQVADAQAGQPLDFNSYRVDDGWHDLRVAAYDGSGARVQGSWRQTVRVANRSPARAVRLSLPDGVSTEMPIIPLAVSATGAPVAEIQLLQNGRVLAATDQASATLKVAAAVLGAGRVELVARAVFTDGFGALSASLPLTITRPAADAPPRAAGSRPAAFSYAREVWPGSATLVDLPALDEDADPLTRAILIRPRQAEVQTLDGVFLLRPKPDADGEDTLTFEAADPAGAWSAPATIKLRYCQAPRIVAPPASTSACLGDMARLEVKAEADTPLTYQWYKDGEPLLGSVQAELELRVTRADQAGTYRVAVQTRCDRREIETLSAPATLTLKPANACRRSIFLPRAMK